MPLSRRTLLQLLGPALVATGLPSRTLATGSRPGDVAGVTRRETMPLLSAIPAAMRDADPVNGQVLGYTSFAREALAAGLSRPDRISEDDPSSVAYLTHVASIAVTGSEFYGHALSKDWVAVMGFDLAAIDEVVTVGLPPDTVTIVTGAFDLERIEAALTANSYDRSTVAGRTVMTRVDDGRTMLEHPISRVWLQNANCIALADDRTVVLSRLPETVATVLRVMDGEEPSLGGASDVSALFPPDLAPLTGAWVLDGLWCHVDRYRGRETELTPGGIPLLPEISLLAFGTTAGAIPRSSAYGPDEAGYPVGENQIRILFADAAAASEAAGLIVERLAAGHSFHYDAPWSALLGETVIVHDESSPLVTIRVPEWIPGLQNVAQLAAEVDIAFLLWQ